ncbi:hypothetical protein OXX79_003551 [Metschnikowia pulcherrima]
MQTVLGFGSISLIFLAKFVAAEISESILVFKDRESAINTVTAMAKADTEKTEFDVMIDEKIIRISNLTLNEENLQKRWTAETAQVGASWTEYHCAEQGVYKSDLRPASCVHSNGHGASPYLVALTRAASYDGNWKTGFNPDFAMLTSLHLGHEVAKKNTVSETGWYTVPAYGYGQVWSEQIVVWQNQQRRICTMHAYGAGGISCDPWSATMRGDLPVVNGVHFVWNTDWQKMDFNNCGGGS